MDATTQGRGAGEAAGQPIFWRDLRSRVRCKDRLQNEAGVRLIDLIDHIQLPPSAANIDHFREAGYEPRAAAGAAQCFVQEQGLFPPIVIGADSITRLFLKVESVADFVSRLADRAATRKSKACRWRRSAARGSMRANDGGAVGDRAAWLRRLRCPRIQPAAGDACAEAF